MPVLSMFYGIIIRMFNDDHNPPHVHVSYSGQKAMVSFNGKIIEGKIPRKQLRLVKAWIEIHREELEANWELAKENNVVFKIEPLK